MSLDDKAKIGLIYAMISQSSATEIVMALYRHLLGREADSEGLAAHRENLIASFDNGGFGLLLESFLGSEERKGYTYEDIRNSEIQKLGSYLSGLCSHYNFVSIGSHCYTSYLLKRANLKKYSYPFDWIFSSNAMINHCITDDFAIFLDKQYYSPIELYNSDSKSCDHRYYKDNYGVNSLFNHRNPVIDIDYEYTLRTVNRFRSIMLEGNTNVFFATFRHSSKEIANFLNLSEILTGQSPSSLVIGVAVDTPQIQTSKSIFRINGNTSLSYFTPSSEWLDVKFASPLDDVSLFRTFADQAFELAGRSGT